MRKIYGFTLVEMIIVVAIIGILAGAIMLSIGNQQRAARDSRRKSDLINMKKALEQEEFETSALSVGIGNVTKQADTNGLAAWNTFIPKAYMSVVPLDPANAQYKRVVWSNGTTRVTSMRCVYYLFRSTGYNAVDDKYAYKLSSIMENDWQATAADNGAGTNNVQSYELYSGPAGRGLPAAYSITNSGAPCP